MSTIKALAFDTGGTVLDWHSGMARVLQATGERHGASVDWHAAANDYRRRAMQGIVGQVRPAFNFDGVHRRVLDETLMRGYRTAFVRRPDEWGPAGPPDPVPNPACDLIVDGFAELNQALLVA